MPTITIVDEPAGLTSEWLTEVLHAAGVDAAIGHVSVERMGTGQMASCYRLEITYARGAGPDRLIAKLPSPDPAVRAGAAMTYRTEVCFYRDLAPRLPVRVPRCYAALIGDEGPAFTLILEDMAPATVGDQFAGCTPEQARDAAVAVAGLHAGSWCDPSLADLDWLIPPMRAHAEVMGPALVGMVETFLGKRQLDPKTAGVFRDYAARFVEWCTARTTPWSLVHNDYRLDNLLFAPPGTAGPTVTTVDWQSLTTGEPLRDVGYFLGTGLDPATRRDRERAILDAYVDRLHELGVQDYDRDRCWDDYRHGLFQGPLICVLGEAHSAPTERGLQMFTTMAERAAAAIVDLDAFAVLDGPSSAG